MKETVIFYKVNQVPFLIFLMRTKEERNQPVSKMTRLESTVKLAAMRLGIDKEYTKTPLDFFLQQINSLEKQVK